MTATRTVHLRIEGRVQGVGYRYWAADRARELHLVGWVRNRRDGSVEGVFSGPAAAVERMIALCADGPPEAAVTSVETVGEGTGVFEDFTIEPTA
ncbi:MAG TPA: acylphosphatase [Aestuariivirgaceae bacterium]|jgi:acylphosphatase|nr:acylphosphatase [Aestuariivirgaceae bacterium]